MYTMPGTEPQKNWSDCIVYVETKMSSSKAQRTIGHEIGHCLGLTHCWHPANTGKSIMITDDDTQWSDYRANKPTSSDAFMLDILY